MEKERKQFYLNVALHFEQREESVTEGFRGFSSSDDYWLQFLKGYSVENQKYYLLNLWCLQRTDGLSWVLHGKCDLELEKRRAFRKVSLMPTNILGSCTHWELGSAGAQ